MRYRNFIITLTKDIYLSPWFYKPILQYHVHCTLFIQYYSGIVTVSECAIIDNTSLTKRENNFHCMTSAGFQHLAC